eukprot:scaffold66848_cov66-Cyclotella_meneghiniana.AAC.2
MYSREMRYAQGCDGCDISWCTCSRSDQCRCFFAFVDGSGSRFDEKRGSEDTSGGIDSDGEGR